MQLIKICLTSLIVVIASSVFAQKGVLKGQIVDDETGEPLIGATISIKGSTVGAVADFDGNYTLSLDEGIHDLVLQFVSYTTVTIEDIKIEAGKAAELNFRLKSDAAELQTVVVTGEVAKDSDIGLLTVQRKSDKLLDGISSQMFDKIGDSDMASAMKRVTGVSVQGGKYIYVRGLGDRYTQTTLNDMAIPGLDPDNNSVQVDIFPTGTIDNIMVYKTFSPDLSGNFSGGIVNVETKGIPDEKFTSFSFGLGYNPAMNLKSDFLLYEGGDLDFLGFDDGSRKLPLDKSNRIPSVVSDNPELEKITRSFSPYLATDRRQSFLNTSFSFNHGNKINKDDYVVGYTAVLNYRDNYEYYDNTFFGDYLKSNNPSVYQLQPFEERKGAEGRRDVLWSGLLSGSIKVDSHQFSASVMRSQNGISRAADRVSRDFEQTGATLDQDILSYTQRAVTNASITGEHNLRHMDVEWKGSFSHSNIYEPDFRTTSISVTRGDTTLNVGDGAGINRFWRNLNEINKSFKVDINYPLAEEAKLKFGGLGIMKNRDFEVLNYTFRITDPGNVPANPNWFLREDNVWTPAEDEGTYVIGNFEPANSYNAAQNTFAFYAMADMKVLEKLRAIYGIRAEKSLMYYTGQNNIGTERYKNQQTLNELDILPSVNIVYEIQDDMNMRASFNKTLARPTFREKSIAQLYDPISDRTFIGNLDLEQTNITNYDLRWEYFFSSGEMVSVSGFYKSFDGHIELTSFEVAPDNVKPRNSGKSVVYGTEVEFRKNFGFITPTLSNFSFGTNLSLVHSAIDLKSVMVNNSGKSEYELRKGVLREGEKLEETRMMAGQAPYVLNAYISYANKENDLNASLSYNVQGETLTIVGSGRISDIYTRPFNSLNLNISKNFGKDNRSQINLGIDNILGDKNELVYKSYGADDINYSIYNPSTTYSVKYAYRF